MNEENPTWVARLTTETEEEQEKAIGDLITRLNKFSTGDLRTCPICNQPIDKIMCWHGIDVRVLYVKPCNCRLGCWEDAPNWAREAGIVEDDTSYFDECMREPTCDELREDYPDEDWTGCEDDPIDTAAQERAGQKRLPGIDEEESS